MNICSVCKNQMTPYEEGQTRHPTCYDMGFLSYKFEDFPGEMNAEAAEIKRELSNVILWADSNSERSQQLAVGPSELGDPCDRRLAYRIAGVPVVNETDPWPAIVGTSVHTWLERAVGNYSRYTKTDRYLTELIVQPDGLVLGHLDLYDRERKMIVDYKTVSTTSMKKFKDEGPPEGYITQINLYGMGMINAGYPVEKVCLVMLARSGWLSGMHVWVEKYDPIIAQRALDRVYELGARLMDLDVMSQPHHWEQIDASPSKQCAWCPFYRYGPDDGQGANDRGCPGR